MPNYIGLINFTTQGVQSINDSPQRADEFVKNAESRGIKVKELFWTAGVYDGVLIIEAPDDAAAASTFLSLAKSGNVSTCSMRAFDRSEIEACLPE